VRESGDRVKSKIREYKAFQLIALLLMPVAFTSLDDPITP